MARKDPRNTRRKIVTAAWKLFYEQGYDRTTVDQIILESGTSKGSFYHYFSGKDALLSSLSSLFDDKVIEDTVSVDLMSRMYATQLTTMGEKHLLDQGRTYYKLLRKISQEGQQRGEIANTVSPAEFSRIYAMCERALIYDWCIRGGEYSLAAYSADMLPKLLHYLRIPQ